MKKDYTHTITRPNGNGQPYTTGIPKLIIAKFGNDTARKHFEKSTGLVLVERFNHYETQPKTFKQLYKVFAVYDWCTTYYNNASTKNTLYLAHHITNDNNPLGAHS